MFIKSFLYCCVISERERIDLSSLRDETFLELDLMVSYLFDWYAIGNSFVKDEKVFMEVFRDFVIKRRIDGLEEVLGTTVTNEAKDM